MELRDYQQDAINYLYEWFKNNKDGNPCLVMPTGSGKSLVVAALCKDALQSWPETQILMLTHVKELIEQNAEKLKAHWPGAPLGIYSAGLRQKVLGEPITFGSIQSLRTKAKEIGHVDLLIIDECHLVSHREEGGYRGLIKELKIINPAMRVVGLTATPFRLGHGYIHDGKGTLFSDLIEPITIEELIHKGFLAPLRSKITKAKLDASGVQKRGGEYIESQLQAAIDKTETNYSAVREVIERAEGRKAWLFFCVGVAHAMRVKDALIDFGIKAECITGETPRAERERILKEYKAGKITALTNANVLTTGFDYPNIDLIALMRPTLSPSLYIQMAGRGTRLKEHTDHCLVLDFAGVVETHGPITAVNPPKKPGERVGDAPAKVCKNCGGILHLSARICDQCGYEFQFSAPELKLREDVDIMGLSGHEMMISSWEWRIHESKQSGKKMLCCTYYGNLSDKPVKEYLTILHDGFAGTKSKKQLINMALEANANLSRINNFETDEETLAYIAMQMGNAKPPEKIEYKMDGRFHRVLSREWINATEEASSAY